MNHPPVGVNTPLCCKKNVFQFRGWKYTRTLTVAPLNGIFWFLASPVMMSPVWVECGRVGAEYGQEVSRPIILKGMVKRDQDVRRAG